MNIFVSTGFRKLAIRLAEPEQLVNGFVVNFQRARKENDEHNFFFDSSTYKKVRHLVNCFRYDRCRSLSYKSKVYHGYPSLYLPAGELYIHFQNLEKS